MGWGGAHRAGPARRVREQPAGDEIRVEIRVARRHAPVRRGDACRRGRRARGPPAESPGGLSLAGGRAGKPCGGRRPLVCAPIALGAESLQQACTGGGVAGPRPRCLRPRPGPSPSGTVPRPARRAARLARAARARTRSLRGAGAAGIFLAPCRPVRIDLDHSMAATTTAPSKPGSSTIFQIVKKSRNRSFLCPWNGTSLELISESF